MAPRRVIEDSDEDEDEDGFAAPELLSPSVIANEVSSVPMMQPLSTGEFEPCPCTWLFAQTKQHHHRPNTVSSCV